MLFVISPDISQHYRPRLLIGIAPPPMNQLRFLARLVFSQLRMHPGRAIVTTLGIVASTCAVVWVVSGYDALVSQFDENAGKYLGRYDALIMPIGGPPGTPTPTIDDSLIAILSQDAGVLEVNPVSNARVSATKVRRDKGEDESESSLGLLVGDRPPVNGAPPVGPTLVSTPALEAPYELVEGRWLDDDAGSMSAVLGENVAKEMQVNVGDELQVTTFGNRLRLSVVGIVEQAPEAPSLRGGAGGGRRGGGRSQGAASEEGGHREKPRDDLLPRREPRPQTLTDKAQVNISLPSGMIQGVAASAIYVRPDVASKINGYTAKPQVLQIAIRDTVTIDQFRDIWQAKLAAYNPPMQLVDYFAVRKGLESTRSVYGQQSQAWAATGMASLAAIAIIFSTLSMGVTERIREFAMLRAIALTRTQIASIIAIESIAFALIGWTGGLFAGWLMVLVGGRMLPGLFSSGAVLGWSCVLLTGVTVMVGAIGAAVLPAWRAMRIRPLDAMSDRATTRRLNSWAMFGVIGLALVVSTPIVVFALPMDDDVRKWCYSFITYPMLLVGMILLAPAIVVLGERLFAPIVTNVLRLDPRMMKTQLSSNLWRSVGATLALSVGLGLYASTQTWGYSMLVPFTPGNWLPDALVAFHPVGIAPEVESLISEVDGVNSDEVMPLAIEQAKVDWGVAGEPSRLRTGADNAIICGLDPQFAFSDTSGMLPVTFVEGTRESAIESLAGGGACVIAEDYAMATGLGVGDSLTFIPPSADDERVEYKIAGVVALPGWQWVSKFSGVRRHFVRTGTMLFANRSDVQKDFHLPRTEFFWVNFQPTADHEQIEAEFQSIAERHAGGTFTAAGVGEVQTYRPFARMTTTENVKKAIQLRADDMIWGMSYLPLITLIVMSLAVANTIIASVRSRTWEFGVMRSVGVTRGQLVRLVIAETILIGIAACVLSLLFGLIAGWCGVGMAQFGGWFAGPPSFRIPWMHLSFGFALTLMLCLLAGLWPAIKTGRAEPLGLLQAGRSLQ